MAGNDLGGFHVAVDTIGRHGDESRHLVVVASTKESSCSSKKMSSLRPRVYAARCALVPRLMSCLGTRLRHGTKSSRSCAASIAVGEADFREWNMEETGAEREETGCDPKADGGGRGGMAAETS